MLAVAPPELDRPRRAGRGEGGQQAADQQEQSAEADAHPHGTQATHPRRAAHEDLAGGNGRVERGWRTARRAGERRPPAAGAVTT